MPAAARSCPPLGWFSSKFDTRQPSESPQRRCSRSVHRCCLRSIRVLAQQQPQRDFSRALGLGDAFEEALGTLDRTGSAGAIDLPPPGFGRRRPIFHDNGKVGMFVHGGIVSTEFRKIATKPRFLKTQSGISRGRHFRATPPSATGGETVARIGGGTMPVFTPMPVRCRPRRLAQARRAVRET